MKRYEFQYTGLVQTILFIIGICIVVCFVIALFISLKCTVFWTYFVAPALGISLFFLTRKLMVHDGMAEIYDQKVMIKLINRKYDIEFDKIISFKKSEYQNGLVLYLKTSTENIRLEANTNFCNSTNFDAFVNDLVDKIRDYKNGS